MPGSSLATALAASNASRIFCGLSLMSVGSKPVVPNFLCAAAMLRTPCTVG
jgi:hypothetical protein